MKSRLVSIVVPVYNEEATVGRLLAKVVAAKLPAGFKKEIIVVDDGSRDRSRDMIYDLRIKNRNIKLITHRKNRGKGAALKTGFGKAGGEVIIIQDADLEYNPSDYEKLIKPIMNGGAQVVYGSRLKKLPFVLFGENKTPLPMHYVANKFLSLATNLIYGSNLTDMETCYKVFKKRVLKDFEIKADRFDFEAEFTAKVLKAGYKIVEVPISTRPRGYDEGKKIGFWDGVIALWTIIKYRFVD